MTLVTIGNTDITVTISLLGAEMQAIATPDGREWLWNGDAQFWTGRAPVLFPIVGRAPGDRLTIGDDQFVMAQHGVARRSLFTLVESSDSAAVFELVDTPTTRQNYPFVFALRLSYAVAGRSVMVSAEVTNRDTRPMPFALGFHPAFRWPLPGADGEPHGVWLDNGGMPALRRLDGGLLTPDVHPSPFKDGALTLDHAMFEADAMIFPDGAGAGARFGTQRTQVHLTWENLPNFALWSKPGAPFLCLEPWHGMAAEEGGTDRIEDRPFIETLGPAATARFGYRAALSG